MKISINKSVISKSIDKIEMILNVQTGIYHELNESGSLVWLIIKNNSFTKDELVEKISSIYEDDEININDFIDDLKESKLIEFL